MTILHVDFETRSLVDLTVCGLDNYARHPSTQPILLSWAFDEDDVSLWQPHLEPELPREVKRALTSDVTISAWNAQFERNIFHRCLGLWVNYSRWLDPMIWARHLSLPGYLDKCGKALGVDYSALKIDNVEKIKIHGKQKTVDVLIHKFCEPYSMGGEETLFGITQPEFHDWNTHPKEWERFCQYCIQDTVSERALSKILKKIPLPQSEQEAWWLDQKINDTGIPSARWFVDNALGLAAQSKADLKTLLKEKTALTNPNSRDQMLKWVQAQGYPYNSLKKGTVALTLADKNSGLTLLAREVLEIRKEAAKSSYKKLEKMQAILSPDGRLRNQFMFLGASRSGRWSGSGVQVHNLPRPVKNVEKNYDRAVEIIASKDYTAAKEEFSPVVRILDKEVKIPSAIGMATSCIRSAFQAPEDKIFVVCDLGAIENRVLGWLAGCDAILKVFRDGLDPYVSFGVKMYHQEYEILIKDKNKRQIAKPAVLGAGYGLGGGELHCDKCKYEYKESDNLFICEQNLNLEECGGDIVKGGLWGYAENMGVAMSREEAHLAVKVFRDSYPEIAAKQGLWTRLEKAAMHVIKNGSAVKVGSLIFTRRKREDGSIILRIQLPSGRGLHYMNAKIRAQTKKGRDGKEYQKEEIIYDGIGHGVGKMQQGWGEVKTYGGKLCENVVQAISRDVLVNGMMLADEMGAEIVMHVHDEIVVVSDDAPFSFSLSDLQFCMTQVPEWAPGLPLAAEGYSGKIYKKG